MALHVRVAPCLLNEPAQGVLDRTVRSGPGSPVLAAQESQRRGHPALRILCVPVLSVTVHGRPEPA